MSVKCAQCGEELLGAVNRCWRCGTLLQSRDGNDAPPVIVTPRVVTAVQDGPLEAQILESPDPSEDVVRAGSPFAATTPTTTQPTKQPATFEPPRPAPNRDWNASTISSWVAVVVVIYGWVLLSFNSIIAFSLALVALALGIFGLWGRHRAASIVAMILCCFLIAFAGYHMFVDIFTWAYGYGPFESPEYSDTWPPDPSEP
jgi:hypothetical protein